jgi:hypothetical protein
MSAQGIRTKTVHHTDYEYLDQLILTEYGHDFEVVADQEVGNDSTIAFDDVGLPIFEGDEVVDRWDRDKLETFKATGRGLLLLRILLNDMALRGVIPKGDYVISVSW